MLQVIHAIVLLCVIGATWGQAQQQPQPQPQPCWNHFAQTFTQCTQNNTINTQHLMYLVRNQTDVEPPADIEAFKTQACGMEQQIFNCTWPVRTALLNNSQCSQAEKETIHNFVVTVFNSYDLVCAHPCRFTMLEKFRDCYTNAGLDANLFSPNATQDSEDEVLGASLDTVTEFCEAKDNLVSCMKREQMSCADSTVVLSNIEFNLDTMKTTFDVFCSHPKVYLDTTKCFSEPSRQVRDCVVTHNNDIFNLGKKAQDNSMAPDDFMREFCMYQMKNMKCDLEAWRNNTIGKCNDAVVGMKTELDCKLIPEDCKRVERVKYDAICHEKNYQNEVRINYGNGAGVLGVTSGVIVVMFLLLSMIT